MTHDPIPDNQRRYLEALINNSEFSGLQGEARERKLYELSDKLDVFVHNRIIAAMDTPTRLAYGVLRDADPPMYEEIGELIHNRMPNVNAIQKQATHDFWNTYVK